MRRLLAAITVASIILIGQAQAKSLGDAELQRDTWRIVAMYATALHSNCKPKRVSVNVVKATRRGKWSEKWTVKSCNKTLVFIVDFAASPRGGTDIVVHSP